MPLCTSYLKIVWTRRAKGYGDQADRGGFLFADVFRDQRRRRSDKRQRSSIAAFAKSKSFHLVGEFYDAAVSGADPIETRPGFTALLDRIEGNGVRVVLVEDASRFARDLVAQELGLLMLGRRGVRVLTAGGDDLTDTSDPDADHDEADRGGLCRV